MVCKNLEPLHMASSVPWFWVLEALGHVKQVDPAILIELVQKIPNISDDLAKNAREIVSLRILENLYDRAIQKKDNHMPVPCSQIGLDPSDCCEDVLHRILQGESAANLKLGGTEILKWDILSFIKHKRSCLPSCTLQKLKYGILEGSNPLLSSWKDRSGLAVTNESQRGIPTDCGDSDGITKNKDVLLQEVSHDINLLPAKRDRSATCEGQCNESESTREEASKKLKQDFVCIAKNVNEISGSVQQHGFLADSSAKVVEHIQDQGRVLEKETQIGHIQDQGCVLEKETQIGHIQDQGCELENETQIVEESGPDDDHHCEGDASATLPLSDDCCHIEMMDCEQQVTHSDSKVPGETYKDGDGDVRDKTVVEEARGDGEGSLEPPTLDAATAQDVVEEDSHVHEANNNLGVNFQQNASDGGKTLCDDEHHNHSDMSSDSDEYDHERVEIASKKNVFLGSQCTFSEESPAQLNLCVKCNKGGYLLVCGSDTCPLVVHESCLGSTANIDGSGNFFCPFCAYSRAISGYLEAKKKSSLARKDLSAFLGMGIEHQFKKPSMRSHRSNQNHSNNTNSLNEVNDPCYLPSTSKRQELEPSRSCPCVNPPYGEKEADMNVESHHLPKIVCQSAGGQGKEQPEIHGHKAGDVISHCRDPETMHGSERREQISKQKVISNQSELDPHRESKRVTSDAEENFKERSEMATTSQYFVRSREQEKQNTSPASPLLKRKKLPWTKVEEDKIKEGVQRFVSSHDNKIQWKKILEYGGGVFQKGRTTSDLKDKWKSIRKISARSR